MLHTLPSYSSYVTYALHSFPLGLYTHSYSFAFCVFTVLKLFCHHAMSKLRLCMLSVLNEGALLRTYSLVASRVNMLSLLQTCSRSTRGTLWWFFAIITRLTGPKTSSTTPCLTPQTIGNESVVQRVWKDEGWFSDDTFKLILRVALEHFSTHKRLLYWQW